MIKELNPLNVHGLRQITTHCPPHFTQVTFQSMINQKIITDWIWENLEGRFYVLSNDGNITAAFELANESTFFSLSLSSIMNG